MISDDFANEDFELSLSKQKKLIFMKTCAFLIRNELAFQSSLTF